MNNIGQNIAKIRKKRGISQQNFANKLSVTQQTISLWEKNERYPQIDRLPEIIDVLDTSIYSILDNNSKELAKKIMIDDTQCIKDKIKFLELKKELSYEDKLELIACKHSLYGDSPVTGKSGEYHH